MFYSKNDSNHLNTSNLAKAVSVLAPNTTKATRKSALGSHNVSVTSLKQKTPNKNS